MEDVDRIVALDISTRTGWALFERSDSYHKLLRFGNIVSEPISFDSVCPNDTYPFNYATVAGRYGWQLANHINTLNPAVVVVEETVPGRETYSQKLLEFFHFAFIQGMIALNWKLWVPHCKKIEVVYVRTGEWRKTVELRMSKEDKRGNLKKNLEKARTQAKYIRSAIKMAGTSKKNRATVENLKRQLRALQLGKVTRKHLSVRMANQLFGLNLKLVDNNEADAIMLGMAYLNGASTCDGKPPARRKEATK